MIITKIPDSRSYVLTFDGVIDQLIFKTFILWSWLNVTDIEWKKMFKNFGAIDSHSNSKTICRKMLQDLAEKLG